MSFPFYKYKPDLIRLGISEVDYDKALAELKTEQAKKDYIWGIVNQLLTDTAFQHQGDLEKMYSTHHQIYLTMWMFLLDEDKDSTHVMKLIHNCTLMGMTFNGLKMNAVVIGGNRCDYAHEIDGKEYPLEEVLNLSVLPYHRCNRKPACNCSYAGKALRDSNDRLIRKTH